MKKLGFKLGLILVSILLVLISFYGCENTSSLDKKVNNKNIIEPYSLLINDDIFLHLIIQDSTNNIFSNIRNIMDDLNLTYSGSEIPVGIALLYDNIIDTSSFNNLNAVIYYYKEFNENRVKVWFENNGSYQLNQNYSKISHFIANEDIFRLDKAEELGTTQVMLMIDQTVIPITQYYSVFQTAIDKRYASLPDPDKMNERLCNRHPDCALLIGEGTCAYRETQMNHVTTRCQPDIGTICISDNAYQILLDNNTPMDTTVLSEMYYIRNQVLLDDNKYEYLIEDYYYLSSIISQNITLSIALDIKDLSNTNFFDIFMNFNNPSYSDSILVTSSSKPIILDICNKSKNLTSDSRSINIINSTISLVNTYENKTITYIKNN